MAGIIFDKKLRTYIPANAKCASACSFLFFAGNERLAKGNLGVHQFYTSGEDEKKAVRQTEYSTQFTVSEIIGFLTEFKTPPFVYERMFEDIEMYYFDETELTKLNSKQFTLEDNEKLKIETFTARKLRDKRNQKPKLELKDIVILIQKRLKEIGCNPGPADGIWGNKTQTAAIAFAQKAGLPTSKDYLISEGFIKKLKDAPKNYCPKLLKTVAEPKTSFKTFFPLKWKFKFENCEKIQSHDGIAVLTPESEETYRDLYDLVYKNNLSEKQSGFLQYYKKEDIVTKAGTVLIQWGYGRRLTNIRLKYDNGMMRGTDSDKCSVSAVSIHK